MHKKIQKKKQKCSQVCNINFDTSTNLKYKYPSLNKLNSEKKILPALPFQTSLFPSPISISIPAYAYLAHSLELIFIDVGYLVYLVIC